jgi:hypothetical protein
MGKLVLVIDNPTATKAPKLPYPAKGSPILLTDGELSQLTETLGEACLTYLAGELLGYAEDHPVKFKSYKSHYRTLLNWHRMKLQKGLEFCPWHSSLPGYYPRWICEAERRRFIEAMGIEPTS